MTTYEGLDAIFKTGNLSSWLEGLRAVYNQGVTDGVLMPEPEPIEPPDESWRYLTNSEG